MAKKMKVAARDKRSLALNDRAEKINTGKFNLQMQRTKNKERGAVMGKGGVQKTNYQKRYAAYFFCTTTWEKLVGLAPTVVDLVRSSYGPPLDNPTIACSVHSPIGTLYFDSLLRYDLLEPLTLPF